MRTSTQVRYKMTEKIKCSTCKKLKGHFCFTTTSLHKGYRRCMECEKERNKKSYLKRRARHEDNPWLKKLNSLFNHVDSIETRKLWTPDIAKTLWESQSKRCALSNEELDESRVAFVKIDKDKDFDPNNAAVVNRWLVSKTKTKDFAWSKDQMARIHDAKMMRK